MKIGFHPSVMVMFTLLLILTACSDDDVIPQSPAQPNPPIIQPTPPITTPNLNRAPIAHAGNDTTVYMPFSTCIFDGSASTDLDNNIISYEWKFLEGQSTAYVNSYEQSKAFVNGLIKVGNYEVELTVTDADRLFSKDTIMVTVAEPLCITPNKELIIKDLKWVHPWFTEIQLNFSSYLPANSYVRNIYIKRDSSDEWEFVMPLLDFNQDPQGLHSWFYSGYLSIYPNQNQADDTPDVKIEYCN